MNSTSFDFLGLPIQTETVDKVLFFAFSVFIAAIVVVGLRVLLAFIVSLFQGLKKLLYYLYLTYTLIWKISVGILQLGIFLILLIIVYYWFVDDSLKMHLKTLASIAPNTSSFVGIAKDKLVVFTDYGKSYWDMNKNSQ